ncbi:MAG: MlaD family protein [Ignavibacteriaceae bacterium]
MKDQKKTEIKVGITVLAGILIFIWIMGWAKNFSLSSSNYYVSVRFDNVAGLEAGDNVTVNGLKKGFVEDMKLSDGEIIVTLSLSKDINLKEDASFFITMLDLMGGKRVEVNPGESDLPLDLSRIHDGKFYADIPEVISLLGTLQDDIVTLVKDVKITLEGMNNYLTDRSLQSDIKNSIANLNEVSEKLIVLVDVNSSRIDSLTANSLEITTQVSELLETNSKNLSESLQNIKLITFKTDSLLDNLIRLSEETSSGKNNLGKILNDEELYPAIKSAIGKLDTLTNLLIEQLQGEGINVDANIF